MIKWAKHYNFTRELPEHGRIIEYVLDGGRMGGKSHHVAQWIIERVSTELNCNAVCCRANATDLSTGVRALIVKKIHELGLGWRFKIPDSDLTITDLYNGNKIYFRAYEKAITRTKGDEPQGNVGIIWVEEGNEGRSQIMLDSMLTTYYRHMINGSQIFFTFNPMPNPQHWSHDYYVKKRLSRDTAYVWCNWTHIARFLSKAVLRKIIDAKHTNEKFYRFWYQGEVVSFDGLIFPQWKREKHYVDEQFFKNSIRKGNVPRLLLFAVDGGTKQDMTAVAPLVYMRNNQLIMLDKYYHNPRKTQPLAPLKQATQIDRFVKDILARYHELKYCHTAFVFDNDSGSQEIMLQLRASYGYTVQAVSKKEVWNDIQKFQDLLDEDLFYLINTGGYKDYFLNETLTNDPFIDEIESFCYCPETNDIKKGQIEHLLKAVIYGVKSIYSDPRVRSLNNDFLKKIGLYSNNFNY